MSPIITMPRYNKIVGKKIQYELLDEIIYYSDRYKKFVTVEQYYISDGATFAPDLASRAWWIHDKVCDRRRWDDGTPISSWQSGRIIRDALKEEGRNVRAPLWGFGTYLFQRVWNRWK